MKCLNCDARITKRNSFGSFVKRKQEPDGTITIYYGRICTPCFDRVYKPNR